MSIVRTDTCPCLECPIHRQLELGADAGIGLVVSAHRIASGQSFIGRSGDSRNALRMVAPRSA